MRKKKKEPISEAEIDRIMEMQADDDSAWEPSIAIR